MALVATLIWTRSKPTTPSGDVSDTHAIQRSGSVRPRSAITRPAHARKAQTKQTNSSTEEDESPAQQPGEAQILVATGYRRLQQRDYEAAREAFEEALSIDPGNSAAKEGLRAAKTAETVEGVAGVFGR